MPLSLANDLRQLKKLKADRGAKKKAYEKADEKFRTRQFKVMERMEKQGVETTKVDGTLFVPTHTIYGQIQDRAEFVAWAQKNDDGLLVTKEAEANLNQLVREKLDNGETLPPGVSFRSVDYIGQRAA